MVPDLRKHRASKNIRRERRMFICTGGPSRLLATTDFPGQQHCCSDHSERKCATARINFWNGRRRRRCPTTEKDTPAIPRHKTSYVAALSNYTKKPRSPSFRGFAFTNAQQSLTSAKMGEGCSTVLPHYSAARTGRVPSFAWDRCRTRLRSSSPGGPEVPSS